jgi:hypothetical protein
MNGLFLAKMVRSDWALMLPKVKQLRDCNKLNISRINQVPLNPKENNWENIKMFKCFDFQCTNQECNHNFDDLVNDETNPVCPNCQSPTDRILGMNQSQGANPRGNEIWRKANLMKKRITGKLPWLKHSYSQTGSD